jgi:predicted O-methyltransferase YrrM
MHIQNPELDNYINELLPERPSYFHEMERYAAENNFPIIGPHVGSLIFQVTSLIKPTRILELGSGFGYSAAWFGLASDKTCEIVCTDADENNKKLAQQFFGDRPIWSKINYQIGDSLELAHNIDGDFDIVFCDIDKWEYPNAFEDVKDRIRQGGCMITDNVLWSGKVLEATRDQDTVGVQEFNRSVAGDDRYFGVIYPIRDGVSVAYKLR